jgi:hypothetical protein
MSKLTFFVNYSLAPQPHNALLFPLGQIVATPLAWLHLQQYGIDPLSYLYRHASGDWGDVCPTDAAENDQSVLHGYRVLSCYTIASETIWIITEADRLVTTLLLSSEY